MKYRTNIPIKRCFRRQKKDAVRIGFRKIIWCKSQLINAAQHSLGTDTAQLAGADDRTVSQHRSVKRNRHDGARMNVGRTRHNLQRLAACLDLAIDQTVGIGMWFDRKNTTRHDLADQTADCFNAFHL